MRMLDPRVFTFALALFLLSCSATAADPDHISLGITVYDDPSANPRVVRVEKANPKGIGYRMGIRDGDIIQSVNKEEMKSTKQLVETLKKSSSVEIIWKSGDKRYQNTAALLKTTPVGMPPQTIEQVGKKEEVKK